MKIKAVHSGVTLTAKDRNALTEIRLIRTAEIIRALEIRISDDNRVRAINRIPDDSVKLDKQGTFTWIGTIQQNCTYEDYLMEQAYLDLKAFITKYRSLEKYFGRNYKSLTKMLEILRTHIDKRTASRGGKPLPEFKLL